MNDKKNDPSFNGTVISLIALAAVGGYAAIGTWLHINSDEHKQMGREIAETGVRTCKASFEKVKIDHASIKIGRWRVIGPDGRPYTCEISGNDVDVYYGPKRIAGYNLI